MKRFEAHLERTAPDLSGLFHGLQEANPARTYDALQKQIKLRIQKLDRELQARYEEAGKSIERDKAPKQPGMPDRQPQGVAPHTQEKIMSLSDTTMEKMQLKLLATQLALHREFLKLEGKKE